MKKMIFSLTALLVVAICNAQGPTFTVYNMTCVPLHVYGEQFSGSLCTGTPQSDVLVSLPLNDPTKTLAPTSTNSLGNFRIHEDNSGSPAASALVRAGLASSCDQLVGVEEFMVCGDDDIIKVTVDGDARTVTIETDVDM